MKTPPRRVAALVTALAAAFLVGAPAVAHPGPPSSGVAATTVRTANDRPPSWTAPLTPVTVVRPFDPPPKDWLPGHRGVDLAGTLGTGVAAPADGTVTFAGPVAGRGVLVVTHDDGLRSSFEPVTASVAVGTRVTAGTPVAVLDAGGHCAPAVCLHWGVRLGDAYIDPFLFLEVSSPIVLLPFDREIDAGRVQRVPAGLSTQGYANGQLPASVLCSVSFAPGALLRCDAAAQLENLNAAFHATFGYNLTITDSYRSYAEQVAVKASRGYFAATPGTSNHGWGIAVDLGGGMTSFGSAQYLWMRENAPTYGWDNPTWARPGGTKNEPWHWQYLSDR